MRCGRSAAAPPAAEPEDRATNDGSTSLVELPVKVAVEPAAGGDDDHVARDAAVSRQTVSNVLNGSGRVGDAARARVLAAVEAAQAVARPKSARK